MAELCVRRTFIDQHVAGQGGATQRSHSAPPDGGSQLPLETQHKYDQYMNELQERAATVLPLHHRHRETTGEKMYTNSCTPAKHTPLKEQLRMPNLTEVPASLWESISSEGASSSSAKWVVYQDDGDYQGFGSENTEIAASLNHIVTQKSLSFDFVEHVEPETSGIACNSKLEAGIPADWGHPELCARPCMYFSKGNCTQGASCRFCHCFHDRPPHLDKRWRYFMKSLTQEQRASFIAPLILRKAVEFGISQQAVELLKDLAPTSPGAIEEVPESRLAAIKSTMEKMNLRQLLSMILYGNDTTQDLQGEVIRKHVKQMRICMKCLPT